MLQSVTVIVTRSTSFAGVQNIKLVILYLEIHTFSKCYLKLWLFSGFWSTMGWSGRKSGFFLQMETLESFNRKSLLYLILSFLTGDWCCCSLRPWEKACIPLVLHLLTPLCKYWVLHGYSFWKLKGNTVPGGEVRWRTGLAGWSGLPINFLVSIVSKTLRFHTPKDPGGFRDKQPRRGAQP